ncbi:2517_t:CDS:2, partial [Racocetra fulgida]
EQNEYAKSIFANNLKGMDAFMNDYVNFYGRKSNQGTVTNAEKGYKSEFEILKENHKFLRSDEDDESELTWEQRLAKKYYDKLFKEYCIAELKYYKEGKIALRWRTEKEVIIGKGQLTCASTRCSEKVDLKSWEVNFAYVEDDSERNKHEKRKRKSYDSASDQEQDFKSEDRRDVTDGKKAKLEKSNVEEKSKDEEADTLLAAIDGS